MNINGLGSLHQIRTEITKTRLYVYNVFGIEGKTLAKKGAYLG